MAEVDELIGFLGDSRPEARLMAVNGVQGLTGSPEGLRILAGQTERLAPVLLRMVSDQPDISKAALSSLVNLSQEQATADQLRAVKAVSRSMDYVREGTTPHEGLLVMLLTNLTAHETGCRDLLQSNRPELQGLHVAILLKRFMQPATPPDDAYAHVGSILTNLTRLKEARCVLLQPGRGLLSALQEQLQSPTLVRRQSAAGTLRNICLSAEADGTLDSLLSSTQWLTAALDVLCGTHKVRREPDDGVREALGEAVLLLAQTEAGRKTLWTVDAPVTLRTGYETEEHLGVCEAMERIANLFLSDSGSIEEAP